MRISTAMTRPARVRGLVRMWFGTALLLALVACATPESTMAPDLVEDSAQDPQQAIASQVPNTDIFLFEINPARVGLITAFLGNATQRPGYDNQPFFIRGSNNFLFSSIADGVQSDVFEYLADSATLRQRTNTPLSEYSPTPLADGGMACVTVEQDGTQRLWQFDANGRPFAAIRPDITGVGYHAFIDDALVALFLVEEPLRLVMASRRASQVSSVSTNIGRSLHQIPGTAHLSYVQQLPDESRVLMSYDAATQTAIALVTMPEGVEDMTYLPSGIALTVADGKLLQWPASPSGMQPHAMHGDWQQLHDLHSYFQGSVTRLAVNDSATRLAIVVELEDQ